MPEKKRSLKSKVEMGRSLKNGSSDPDLLKELIRKPITAKRPGSAESICSTRTRNVRSHEENKLGDDSTTIISTINKSVDALKTVSSNEEKDPNDVSMKHKKCKSISQEQSLEANIDDVKAIHQAISTNQVDNEVGTTASDKEFLNNVNVMSNGCTGSTEKVTSISQPESDCLNDNNTVLDNDNSMVPAVENEYPSSVLNADDCHNKSASIGFYPNEESAEPTCQNMQIVLHNNNVDQVKILDREISSHSDVMEVNDTGIVNEDKWVEPSSKMSASTYNNGENLNIGTTVQVQTNNNIDIVQCTINTIQNFYQEQENNLTTVGETTSRTDLDVKLQQSNGSLNACNENDDIINDSSTKDEENKTLVVCPGETSIDSVTNKAVESSNLLPELLVQTKIAEDRSLLGKCDQENDLSTLTKLTKETSDCFKNNESGTTVPEGKCQPCSTDDVMRTDMRNTLGEPIENLSISGNDVQISTNQMSSSLQLNCEYTNAVDTAGIACNKDIQDQSCIANELSHTDKSSNKTVMYIDFSAKESSSKDSKTTYISGSGLTKATSLELSHSDQHNVVKHNVEDTVKHHQSETLHGISEHTSIENSAAEPSNRNTEDINLGDSNRKDQVPSDNKCNTDRLLDQICEFSIPDWSKHPTETIESCGDKSSGQLLNSQQSTQNFLETYEAEKAESNELKIAEFERTFASAQEWTREVIETKKSEGSELVKEILTQMCDMNQELMAMKRQLDIVKREMTNNQPKPSTSKFFSKTNSNFSFFK